RAHPGRHRGADHRPGDGQGQAQGRAGQVLRRRHHPQAQAAGAPEGGQEAHEEHRARRGPPGGVHLRPQAGRLSVGASAAWHSVSSSASQERPMPDEQPPTLDERKASVLRAVVEEYIETAQPVGSGHVARAPGVNVSSATVRNDMAVLEQEGYLYQPHTSAGRVPTEKGYRFFVDTLDAPARLPTGDANQVRSFFSNAHGELERMLQDTS